MTKSYESDTLLVGGAAKLEQGQFLTAISYEDMVQKYNKLKSRYKKLKKSYKRSKKSNAELEKLCYEARAEKRFWITISNSLPKALQLIGDVFNAHHRERMLDKQLSKKHKKGKKYYF